MGTVTGIRGETYIQPRTFRSASFQQFRLNSNHRLIGTLTNRKARLSNLEFLTRSEAKLVSVSTLTRRVCDRRPLINCLRALEARMDPLPKNGPSIRKCLLPRKILRCRRDSCNALAQPDRRSITFDWRICGSCQNSHRGSPAELKAKQTAEVSAEGCWKRSTRAAAYRRTLNTY